MDINHDKIYDLILFLQDLIHVLIINYNYLYEDFFNIILHIQ